MKKSVVTFILLNCLLFSGCSKTGTTMSDKQSVSHSGWQNTLKEKLPLLGHRNWIVVTDMAYPLQMKEGIITLYANEPYMEVLSSVKQMIDHSSHVFAHVYQDQELSYLDDTLCQDINGLKNEMKQVLAASEVVPIEHNRLISTLDSISNFFQVIIIKTNLTKPYTSTFFELDCKYWNSDKQAELDKWIQ